MLDKPADFFARLRQGVLGPTLSQYEVDGCSSILEACRGWPLPWTAYALATAYHETAHSMRPVKEIGSAAYLTRMYDVTGQRATLARRMGNTHPGDGVRYAGRGYVQITWHINYAKAEAKLGVPFTTDPDLALDPKHAAAIMRLGMENGWFTGKRLKDYLGGQRGTEAQYRQARRIINGLDKADLIAGHAMEFQFALHLGGWRAAAPVIA